MAGRGRTPKPKPELPKGLGRALANAPAGADSGTLLKDLIEVWGGTRQLAMDVHTEFQKAPSGGMTRQRILEMFQRLILNNTQHEIGRAKSASDMTDEELHEIALEYVKRVTSDGPSSSAKQEEGAG